MRFELKAVNFQSSISPEERIAKASNAMQKFCRDLSFVESVEGSKSGKLILHGPGRSRAAFAFGVSCRVFHDEEPYTEKSKLAWCRLELQELQSYLRSRDRLYLRFSLGGSLHTHPEFLDQLLPLLRAERRDGVVRPELDALLSSFGGGACFRKNFVESPGLDARLEAYRR